MIGCLLDCHLPVLPSVAQQVCGQWPQCKLAMSPNEVAKTRSRLLCCTTRVGLSRMGGSGCPPCRPSTAPSSGAPLLRRRQGDGRPLGERVVTAGPRCVLAVKEVHLRLPLEQALLLLARPIAVGVQ